MVVGFSEVDVDLLSRFHVQEARTPALHTCITFRGVRAF